MAPRQIVRINKPPVDHQRSGSAIANHTKCLQYHRHFQAHKSRMKTTLRSILLLTAVALQLFIIKSQQAFTLTQAPAHGLTSAEDNLFPGVSRDLASFCAGRPSLPIDVASMVVHVKRNVSFNYKLYLFSGDHVFQTGQVIPRDDFRIHSFPVKFKPLAEFWPAHKLDTFQYSEPKLSSLTQVPSETFNLKRFLRPVPLNPPVVRNMNPIRKRSDPGEASSSSAHSKLRALAKPHPTAEELHVDALPGDPGFISHDVARVMEHREQRMMMMMPMGADNSTHHPYNENYNSHIEFDRDDEVSVPKRAHPAGGGSTSGSKGTQSKSAKDLSWDDDEMMIPVGAFSSFHLNLTYLVRKDFGQIEPQLIRVQIDAGQFTVNQLVIISDGIKNSSTYPQIEDYSFLQHRLIRDPNTRITAINQIYEDWITRNFYTIVYIQRKLSSNDDDEGETGGGELDGGKDRQQESDNNREQQVIVSDRLVFRGTSSALLGAEQLDYNVKAAAFITEKNGLHYYLEFLTTGKFYLCAVDWTKRPFKMIDSRRFPIKSTRTQLDNEELLLCPPAVCYSDRPVDEIVGYGRIPFELNLISAISSSNGTTQMASKNDTTVSSSSKTALIRSTNETHLVGHPTSFNFNLVTGWRNNTTNMAEVEERLRALSFKHLETRLHLRDWTWTLPQRAVAGSQLNKQARAKLEQSTKPSDSGGKGRRYNTTNTVAFEWRYELAKRNDIKARQDTYGYVLTGHEIDASYRVYNELYLISANHLITINYTLINETVTSSQSLGDEFFGLSSTLIDPITGAFYDRYENQIFFFKGDRYIGYDYATKKPLDDFVLEAPLASMELDPIGINLFNGGPLVSSLPVVGILGRQHEVDGVYHDSSSDFVYIFNGMKFYKFLASEFKNGTFRLQSLPRMQCINEHFLHGCHFDRAFPNPCTGDPSDSERLELQTNHHKQEPSSPSMGELELSDQEIDKPELESNRLEAGTLVKGSEVEANNFYEQQQMKLRSIAARKPGLISILMPQKAGSGGNQVDQENVAPEGDERYLEPRSREKVIEHTGSQETLFVYLLVTMIVLTFLVTLLLIVMLINWSKTKKSGRRLTLGPSLSPAFVTSNHYLTNQRDYLHQSRQSATMHDSQQLATGGEPRTVISKPLNYVKVLSSNDNKNLESLDSDIIDNSSL